MTGSTGDVLLTGVRPYGEGDPVDVLVRDGIIVEIGPDLAAEAHETVDGRGGFLLPGFVDLHTHLREPGREDTETIETGSRAAALGGYTAVFAMANTDPVADTAVLTDHVWARGQQVGLVDVHPVGAVTVGLGGTQLAELGAMADGVAGVRMFSDDGKCVHDPLLMRRALEYARGLDVLIAQHAEEPRLTVGAVAHEGAAAARLGLAAGRGPPRSRSSPGTRSSPATPVHAYTSVTPPPRGPSNCCAGPRRRASRSPPRSPRTTCCSTTRVWRPTTRSTRSTRRCGSRRTARRCVPPWRGRHRLRRHRSRPARRPGQVLRVRRRAARDARPPDGAVGGRRDDGRPDGEGTGPLDWRGVARVMSERPAEIVGLPDQGRPVEVGSPPTSPSSTRRRRGPSRPARSPVSDATHRSTGWSCRPGARDPAARTGDRPRRNGA